MEYTQTDIDGLAAKLDQLTDGEKAALAAAIVESTGNEVEGFALNAYLRLSLNGKSIIGTTYGGDDSAVPGIGTPPGGH